MLASLLAMMRAGVAHIGVATDRQKKPDELSCIIVLGNLRLIVKSITTADHSSHSARQSARKVTVEPRVYTEATD